MFIINYDKSFIDCSNEQFDYLMYVLKFIHQIYDRNIFEYQVLNAMYEDDMIFNSARFVFSSKKSIDEIHKNYCCLAKIIFIYFNKDIHIPEINNIISIMCNDYPLPDVNEYKCF